MFSGSEAARQKVEMGLQKAGYIATGQVVGFDGQHGTLDGILGAMGDG